MLRKDVKLGFAIGGIMLAVLVVYVLVVPGNDRHPAQLVTDDSQAKVTDKTESGASATDVKPVDVKPADVKPADVKTTDAKATDSKSGDVAPNPISDKPVDTAKADAPPAGGAAAASNTGPDIWDSALNNGKLPPTMMSTTPSPENKAKLSVPAPEKAVADKTTPDKASPDKPSVDTTPADKTASDKTPDASATDKPAVDPTPAVASGRTHVVQPGETLSSISIAVYNDARQWKRIAEANPKVNPNRLKVGSTLVIPTASAAASSSADSAVTASSTSGPGAGSPIDAQTQYRVEANDNLYRISMKLYGRPDRIDKLYELNKAAIGPDKGRLKLHMILKLPEPPTSTLAATAAR